MSRKSGLGRGLDALIPSGDAGPVEGIRQIGVAELRPNPRQPRREVPRAELEELAQSIRQHGVLQPIVVTPAPDGRGYLLVAGERRLQAARQAGLTAVPAVVRVADERLSLELALVENLQREDLDPLEEAEGYRALVEDFGLTHEQVALRVGKGRPTVSNALRLLKLPATVRHALAGGKLSEGHARPLLALPTPQAQAAAAQTILKRGLSVRQTEELVQRLMGRRSRSTPSRRRSPEEADIEEQLRRALGTKVNLRRGRKGGTVVIHFYSEEELEALIDRLVSA